MLCFAWCLDFGTAWVCLPLGETFAWGAATVVILASLYLAAGRNSFAALSGEITSKRYHLQRDFGVFGNVLLLLGLFFLFEPKINTRSG